MGLGFGASDQCGITDTNLLHSLVSWLAVLAHCDVTEGVIALVAGI